MIFLLDVNVLIALFDPAHVSHDAAHQWFESEGRYGWATCPIVENGLARILSHPKYPNSVGSPGEAVKLLTEFKRVAGYEFWPEDVSLCDDRLFEPARLVASAELTDIYLLALAVHRGGALATFDRRLRVSAIQGGEGHLRVIAP